MTKNDERVATKLRLTKRAVDAIIDRWKPGDPRRFWDTELAGFYLQFTPAGYASYLIRYVKPSGVKGDYTIGPATKIGPDQARDVAREKLAQAILHGEDPVSARATKRSLARQAPDRTFAAVARRYVEAKKRHREKGRSYGDEYLLEKLIIPVIGKTPIEEVSRRQVKDLIVATQAGVVSRNVDYSRERNGRTTANKVHATIKRVFEWAADGDLVSMNPAAFQRLYSSAPAKRRGVLTPERFTALWRELDVAVKNYRPETPLALQLYMLTLQRPIDIQRARISDFDFVTREWRIPGRRTKTGEPYLIPLTDFTVPIIESAMARSGGDYLFQGSGARQNSHIANTTMRARFYRAVADIKERSEWPPGPRLELYDFRRYGRTQIVHKLGFSKEVAERVINHAEGTSIDVLYDVHDYDSDVRAAHAAWAEEVRRMVREGA